MANLVKEASVCIFGKDLGFNIHLEFRQYKFAVILLYQQIKPS